MANPFTIQQYMIYESPIWSGCDGSNVSTLLTTSDAPPADYNKVGPMDLLSVQHYVSNEVAKLMTKIQLAETCDDYVLSLNQVNTTAIPPACDATFRNFANASVEQIRNNIITNNVMYNTQILQGKQMFNNYSYTDSYIASQSNDNDKKQLCQRVEDLAKILSNMAAILAGMDNAATLTKFVDEHRAIVGKYQKNLTIRKELEKRVNELYTNAQSTNSKLHLDSTIYTSVLWTILAATIVFYTFKKM